MRSRTPGMGMMVPCATIQASASWPDVQPFFSARVSKSLTSSRFFSKTSGWKRGSLRRTSLGSKSSRDLKRPVRKPGRGKTGVFG